MLTYIDSKVLARFQKFNNFMEEWFDWWNRFAVAEFFGILFLILYQSSNLIGTLSEQDRRWDGYVVVALMGFGAYILLAVYLDHRVKTAQEEDSSEAVKLYEIDTYATANRKWMLFWVFCHPALYFLVDSPIERRAGYAWAVSGSMYVCVAAYIFVYMSLCLAAVRNGKRKQRMKKLVKSLTEKLSAVVASESPEPTPIPA